MRPLIIPIWILALTTLAMGQSTQAPSTDALKTEIHDLQKQLIETRELLEALRAELTHLNTAVEHHGEKTLLEAWREEKKRVEHERLAMRREITRADRLRDDLGRIVRAESDKLEAQRQRAAEEAEAPVIARNTTPPQTRRLSTPRPGYFYSGYVYGSPYRYIPYAAGGYCPPAGGYRPYTPYPTPYGAGSYGGHHHHHHGGGSFQLGIDGGNWRLRIGG